MRRLIRALIPLGITCGLIIALTLMLSNPTHADSIVVDTLLDESDGSCSDGDCSLRDAIAVANGNGVADTITFSPTIFGAGGVITITQGTLTIDEDETTINGDVDADGSPEVEIRYSSGTVDTNGGLIRIRSSDNTIEGLSVTNSPGSGIYIVGSGTQADNNVIVHCWLGLDLSGADRGNTRHGIRIVHVSGVGSSAADNTIQDSVLSGNDSRGISIQDAPGTRVLSNTVGLNPAGTEARSNGSSGIVLFGALTTTIQENVVSGNAGHGIYMTGTQQITITDNIIGLNAAGDSSLGNHSDAGIYMDANVTTATIRGNTISGNWKNGIRLGPDTTGVIIASNRIGTDITGTTGLGNGRGSGDWNRDGIQIVNAYSNTVGGPTPADRNIIAHNGRAGVFISGEQADFNVVQNNYIGTGINGSENLGNGDFGTTDNDADSGIYLEEGADHNIIAENLIRFNYVGVYFSGGFPTAITPTVPPQHNQVLSNVLTLNDRYGILNQNTHTNITYPTPSDGDNLIQNNVITGTSEGCSLAWCTGIGIFNYGGSPRIISNTISQNKAFGIVNRVYFGTDGPDDADDDLLSMPTIVSNTISGNGDDGIQSRDTTPLNKATLLDDNTFVNNSGEPHISQRWFVAVEVVSGTQTINSGLAVTITRQSGGQACPGGPCTGSTFASAGGSYGVWGPSGISYTDVENVDDGTTTWFEVIEYEVDWNGNWMTYTSHLVEVGGAQLGSRYFDFDGITTTEEISGEVNLPFCLTTGITGTDHSLCRYQIAQVPVFAAFSDGDWDDDSIPDEEEGTGDADGDGVPNYQDTDSDDDGIPDQTEGTGDADGDSVPNYLDTDADGDGIPDNIEGTGDTDGDSAPDYLDTDADGDGIPDQDEASCSPGVGSGDPCDSDGDSTPDYKDSDSDNDGVADNAEQSGDTDGDGIPNYRDTDSDNDGLDDDVDTDDDNDGISDVEEGLVDNPGTDNDSAVDTDGDGLPDYLDPDSDGDGVADSAEGTGDTDNDGTENFRDTDSDDDGTPDELDTDDDNDGISDAEEGLVDNPGTDSDSALDSDGDGLPDYLDPDSDGDGIPDWVEAGCTSQPGSSSTCPEPDQDSDGDGQPDRLDTDSDDDGTDDGDEWYDGTVGDAFCSDPAGRDTDGDGTDNCQDNDVDGDGLFNYQDPDSDGDRTPDSEESHTETNPAPFNHGDVPAWLDPIYRLYLPLVRRNAR